MTSSGSVDLNGTLLGRGGLGAAGGSFGLEVSGGAAAGQLPRRILIDADGNAPAGSSTLDSVLSPIIWAGGGFDKVRLASSNMIEFAGDVSLSEGRSITLSASELRVDGETRLSSPYVRIEGDTTESGSIFQLVPVPTFGGNGTLRVDAGLIDLSGAVTINGVRQVALNSASDIRATGVPTQQKPPATPDLAGVPDSLVGYLVAPGNIGLTAQQVYPTTFSQFSFSVNTVTGSSSQTIPGGSITVSRVGPVPAVPLSSGGVLTLQADTITQGGVVRAPLGSVRLEGGSAITLEPGSITSVAGASVPVLFGETVNGQTWSYAGVPITALPAKSIALDAPSVSFTAGAVLDVSGGGSVQAVEWIPGIGGSNDVLLASNTYAILPPLRLTHAPVDTDLAQKKDLGFSSDASLYDTVYFPGGGGLPAGYYPLLPGYYALLPGAYKIALQPGSSSTLVPGQAASLPDGTPVIAGKLAVAGTNLQSATWSAFAVEPGSRVGREAEYSVSTARFFVSQAVANGGIAPLMPADAGQVIIAATDSLELGGQLLGSPRPGGAGARVDISAPKLAIVSQPGQAGAPDGYVELDAADLSRLDASLLVGGTRTESASGTVIQVGADDILVRAGVQLTGPDLMLAANDSIALESGSRLQGSGTLPTRNLGDIQIVGSGGANDGAFLRASSGLQSEFTRGGSVANLRGTLDIAAGAIVSADGSLIADATQTTHLGGSLQVAPGGSITLGARRIGFGGGGSDALVLGADELAQFSKLDTIAVRSYTSVDLYRSVSVGGPELSHLTLDTPLIAGYGATSDSAAVSARQLTLQSSGGSAVGVPTGVGTLSFIGDRIVFGTGGKAIAGFRAVSFNAGTEVVGDGVGTMRVSSDVGFATPRITGTAGATQALTAVDGAGVSHAISIAAVEAPADAQLTQAAGAQWMFVGSRILVDSVIDLPSGAVTLQATGTGNADTVSVGGHGRIHAGGYERSFSGQPAFAPGGNVTLASVGALEVQDGAVIDVGGAAHGGDAGTLSITAGGAVQIDGTLLGSSQPGYRQGTFTLDAQSLPNFSAVNAKLNAGGFSEGRELHVRTGDVTIAAGDTVAAHEFQLSADKGTIQMLGTIDASSTAGGGRVELDAGQGLVLADGSRISVSGTSTADGAGDAYSNGGTVFLSTVTGSIAFAPGAAIDASAALGGKSAGGNVWFSAPRTSSSVAMDLRGTVDVDGFKRLDGAGNVVAQGSTGTVTVEGYKRYDGITNTSVASASNSTVWNDYQTYISNAGSIRSRLQLQGVASSQERVTAGIELRSSGNMILSSAWDLTSASWNQAGVPGRLALRAAGTLTIQNALGFPDDSLATAPSWSIRLVGGADLACAAPLGMRPLSQLSSGGDVVIANVSATQVGKVRTGTGSIDVAAGRDVVIQDPPGPTPALSGDAGLIAPAAVIYTAGLPGSDGGGTSRYPTGGGDIRIVAQRDVVGAAKQQQYVNDWLRRTTSGTRGVIPGNPASWWVDRTSYRENLGTLGGGDIEVDAGRNVVNLSAVAPSTGRVVAGAAGTTVSLDVQGGGNIDVNAGGDVIGGELLVGRGEGRIVSSGGAGTPANQLAVYLMGQSSDPALSEAAMDIVARGPVFLQNVSNPTIMATSSLPGRLDQGFQNFRAAFFTYAPEATAAVESVTGDVHFDGHAVSKLSRLKGQPVLGNQWSEVLPPRFSVIALQGDIDSTHALPGDLPLLVYPASDNSLSLLAGHSIANAAFQVMDVIPSSQPNWGWDHVFGVSTERPLDQTAIVYGAQATQRYVVPGVAGKYAFVVAADTGGISDSAFVFPREAQVVAGQDLRDVQLDLQNLSDADVTSVRAGRDLKYVPTYANGAVDSENSGGYIRVGGPGRVVVQAGRNIELGTSEGITAGGNNFNISLPGSRSASLAVLAGVTGSVSFDALDQLFAALKTAGVQQDAALGEAAVAKVFTGTNREPGDITMYFSAIRTQGGSGIDLLAPGGNINAGLPTPAAAGRDIGIYTTLGGGIRSYVKGDFNVNQSKVMTMQGGDILLYSLDGNIDAGRGARNSLSTQPPRRVAILDPTTGQPTGLFTFIPPVDAQGSGIRTLTSDPDGAGPLQAPKPGDIFLFAPRGFIDAGEAGIASAGNVVVAALQVLNATNITASGSSTGVPVAAAGGVTAAVAGATNAAASATKSTDQAVRDLTETSKNPLGQGFLPSFISVEVIGFGDEKKKEGEQN